MRAKMRVQVILAAMLLGVVPLMMAHGNQKHVIGTVAEIGAATVTVNTAAEGRVKVNIVPETSFVKSGAAAHLADLKVGDRVVIHAIPKGTGADAVLNATEVRFGKQVKVEPAVVSGDLQH